jgi:hypothetical protein
MGGVVTFSPDWDARINRGSVRWCRHPLLQLRVKSRSESLWLTSILVARWEQRRVTHRALHCRPGR